MEPSPGEPMAELRAVLPAELLRVLVRLLRAGLLLRALARLLLRLDALLREDFARALIPPRLARDFDDFARELDAFFRLAERPRDGDDRDLPPRFRVAISTPFFHSLARVHSDQCKNQFQKKPHAFSVCEKVLIILPWQSGDDMPGGVPHTQRCHRTVRPGSGSASGGVTVQRPSGSHLMTRKYWRTDGSGMIRLPRGSIAYSSYSG